jgi:hypothetical protein
MNEQKWLRFWETVGWAVIVLLSAIGVAGSVAHLLDGGIRAGDVPGYRETTV